MRQREEIIQEVMREFVGENGSMENNIHKIDFPKVADAIANRLDALVREKIAEIKREYIEKYGCNSCWSDEHKCTCLHDKNIIEGFCGRLIHKLKESNFGA